MKILHVITGLDVGGAETMLSRLFCDRGTDGLDMEVVTLTPPGFVGKRMMAAGITVHSLDMASLWTGGVAVFRLSGLIRRIKPDVIVAWMHHAQLLTTLAVAHSGAKTPVIWNVRHSLGEGYAHEKALTRLILRVQALLSRAPAAVIYNSRVAARQYRAIGFLPRIEHVIPNGFQIQAHADGEHARAIVRKAFDIADGQLVVGMVARAHPMKDVGNLVSAFRLLCSTSVRAHLLIVGQGMDAPSPDLVEALARLPRGSWTLSGQRSDVSQWLGGLDVLVLPSAWGEGFPNIVGEAMANGVPCIGTRVGDTEWIIGTTGRSVPPRNSAALAQALRDLCHMDEDRRKSMGSAARQRVVDMFSLEQVIARYGALYEEVAGRPVSTPHGALPGRCEAA